MTNRRGFGFQTSTKRRPAGVSNVPLRSSSNNCSARASSSGVSVSSPSLPDLLTSACAPVTRWVTTAVAALVRALARSFSRSVSFTTAPLRRSRQLLYEDLHPSAAGEPNLPGLLVAHAEIQKSRFRSPDDLQCRLDDRTLDAAAGYRADHLPGVVDGEFRANRAGRGAPRRDDSRQRNASSRAVPFHGGFQYLFCVAHR